MISAWTKHLKNADEIIAFRNTLKGSKTVLDRLTQLLQEYEDSITDVELSPKNYDTPNWDYRQAHTNGMKGAFKLVKMLIDLDQKD